MPEPVVFISSTPYKQRWTQLLQRHLEAFGLTGSLVAVDEAQVARAITPAYRKQIENCRIAFILLSQEYFQSKYASDSLWWIITGAEGTHDLDAIPLILEECNWNKLGDQMTSSIRPNPKQPLGKRSTSEIDQILQQAARDAFLRISKSRTLPPELIWLPPESGEIDLRRLPNTVREDHTVPRGAELLALNLAWVRPQERVAVITGQAGWGKTSLINHWLRLLQRDQYRGAERIFAWSFDRQGPRGEVAVDEFLTTALVRFGDSNPASGALWDRGFRLARLLREKPTLLVLDGLEVFQAPSGAGDLKPALLECEALRALLFGFSQSPGSGLIVATAEAPLAGVGDFGAAQVTIPLSPFQPAEACGLLRKLGVQGAEVELLALAERLEGHPLALRLVAGYLAANFQGDLRSVIDYDGSATELLSGQDGLDRALRLTTRWASSGPMGAWLRCLAVCNRALDPRLLYALRHEPFLPGLEPLAADGAEEALEALRTAGICWPDESGTVDAHPLMREFLLQRKRQHKPEWLKVAWSRLADLVAETVETAPKALAEMSALHWAVRRLCQAGEGDRALREIYLPRIVQGDADYNHRELGGTQEELASLKICFEPDQKRPLRTLSGSNRALVRDRTRRLDRALGRLDPAVAIYEKALEAARERAEKHPGAAATILLDLSELQLVRGRILDATRTVNLLLKDPAIKANTQNFRQALLLTARLAHLRGQMTEAQKRFAMAESQIDKAMLTGVPGYWVCDFIFDKGDLPLAERRAWKIIELARETGSLVDAALGGVILGKLYLSLWSHSKDWRFREEANSHVERGLKAAQRTAMLEYVLPCRLLLGALQRARGELPAAEQTLAQVQFVADQVGYDLLSAECKLERGRLKLAQGDLLECARLIADVHEIIKERQFGKLQKELRKLIVALPPPNASAAKPPSAGDSLLVDGSSTSQVSEPPAANRLGPRLSPPAADPSHALE